MKSKTLNTDRVKVGLSSPLQPINSAHRTIQFTESKLLGCFIVQFPIFHDNRGHFVKTIQSSAFEEHGLEGDFRECFYTTSYENEQRGMHFQTPPSDHAKLLYCTEGSIFDVALDLRVGSPTYGKHEIYELSTLASNAVYLPRGIAHGFCVREPPAVMVYHVTTEHDPTHDAGIRWDSFGAAWPIRDPVVSDRDSSFVSFKDFESPFRYTIPTNSAAPKS
jgi:dTDP-4-dehydrorhamnose 3,5-epimerase